MAHRGVTGVLLVGGASRRFGSPKALARLDGESLAERAHRVLGEAFETVIAVGKDADGLTLPFPVLDDGSGVRATIVGVAAAVRLAPTDIAVVLPTDMPAVTPRLLLDLAAAAGDVDAAVVPTGPLPGAYRRSALPRLEQQIAAGDLALRAALDGLNVRVVDAPRDELRNVNAPGDLTG